MDPLVYPLDPASLSFKKLVQKFVEFPPPRFSYPRPRGREPTYVEWEGEPSPPACLQLRPRNYLDVWGVAL